MLFVLLMPVSTVDGCLSSSLMLQVRNLEKMEFSDEAVMKLTLDIIQITHGVYVLCVIASLLITCYCTVYCRNS